MKSLEKAVNDIKSLKIQGAKEIAKYSLKFLKEYAKKYGFGLSWEVAAWKLEDARPTSVVLHNCLEILKKEKKISKIDKILKELDYSTRKICKIGKKIFFKNCRIMTHCHSGEAMSLIKYNKSLVEEVYVTETRPLMQGIRTLKELKKENIKVTYIVDSAIAHFIENVDFVLVGADCIRVEKPYGLVNKIGTLNLAIVAKNYGKRFYVAASTFKIDKRKKFKIEERDAKEVYPFKLPKNVNVRNPAFDLVPFEFVDYIINEKGIFSPNQIFDLSKNLKF